MKKSLLYQLEQDIDNCMLALRHISDMVYDWSVLRYAIEKINWLWHNLQLVLH